MHNAAAAHRPRTIRLWLTGLVVACVLPVWVCAGYFVHSVYTGKKALIQGHLLEIARNLALDADRELSVVLAVAEGLATSPALQNDDFEALRRQVRMLLAGYPDSDVIVANADGQQVFNSFLPPGSALPRRNVPEIVQRVFATGKPAIGNVFRGAVTGRALISLDMPVYKDGTVRYDLAITVPAARFTGMLLAERLSQGWAAVILDTKGVVVARSRDNDRWVGQSAVHLLPGRGPDTPADVAFETTNLDGVAVLAAFSQAEDSGWSAVVSVPQAILLAEVRQWLWWTGGGALVLSLGGIALATSLARRIAHSITVLVKPAEELGSGRPIMPGRSDLAETEALARALTSAAALLTRRAKERQDADAARHAAEVRLAEREHIFRIVADNSHNWEFWNDPDGQCRWVSPACARIAGRPPQAFLGPSGLTIRDVLHPDDQERWDAHFLEHPDGLPAHEEMPFRVVHSDGRIVHIGHVCSRLTGPGGEELGRRGSNRDITEQYRYEQELLRAKELADAGSRAKSEFLANMSHEIRTPINGVMGMLQLLQTTALNTEQQEYVAMATRGTSRLNRLLSDILDLSKIESGSLVVRETTFGLEDIKQAVLDIFAPMARQKHLGLTFELSCSLPASVRGDDARLRQILLNLVGNAVKYTEAGAIQVTVAAASPTAAVVPGVPLDVVFTVADTGRGIPADKLDAIFKPFVQVDGTYTRQGGVGLGLAIVKRLTELLGGTIDVQSWVGSGTTMCVTLPLTPIEAVVAPTAEAKHLPLAPPGCTVLLVEDDDMNRSAASRMLHKVGYAVREAPNGSAALAILAREPVSLILMDVQMPVMDGLEATRRIRADVSGLFDPTVPIIAMTAFAMPGDRETFLEAGMDDYLAKPVNVSELLDVMRRALERRPGRIDCRPYAGTEPQEKA
ncbi:response regulator [Desulfovibrio aerotolerans]|uniref:histidine kinase n=1 Tax=Solidesulfovibrio aerotolerans TaxID=295255 RepID=A0A7C9IVD0_9BACT|nr:ATP-binding protein [Solidesulfovibrio aerotolerans]MYL82502.1 response regulator [Solidesulfovibrio aerotolerans]